MSDLNRYAVARLRVDELMAEADRERLARSVKRTDRPDRPSLATVLGGLLIRAGRALGGDLRAGKAATASLVSPGGHGAPVAGFAAARPSASAGLSTAGLSVARRPHSVRRDRLDRLARDLDRLAHEVAAGETRAS